MPIPVPRERATIRDREVGRIINTTKQYGLRIALEATAYDIWPSVLCAVIEQETGFRNVYGHDPVRWPQVRRRGCHPPELPAVQDAPQARVRDARRRPRPAHLVGIPRRSGPRPVGAGGRR